MLVLSLVLVKVIKKIENYKWDFVACMFYIHRQGESATNETVIKMPSIEVDETPLTISMTTDSVGNLMSLLPVTYKMTNHSQYLLTLTLTVDASPSFMFSGQKQVSLLLTFT